MGLKEECKKNLNSEMIADLVTKLEGKCFQRGEYEMGFHYLYWSYEKSLWGAYRLGGDKKIAPAIICIKDSQCCYKEMKTIIQSLENETSLVDCLSKLIAYWKDNNKDDIASKIEYVKNIIMKELPDHTKVDYDKLAELNERLSDRDLEVLGEESVEWVSERRAK